MARTAPADGGAEGLEVVDLLPMEREMMMIDGVTTISFFSGTPPRAFLEDRVCEIVSASPWIAGKLARIRKRVRLAYDAKPTRDFILDRVFATADGSIGPKMCYEDVLNGLKSAAPTAHVASGNKLRKKGSSPARFTLLTCSSDLFALVFSISHVVADGFTHYAILNQLSSDSEVVALSPKRHEWFPPKLDDAVGKKEFSIVMGAPGLIVNYVSNMTFRGKPRARVHFVDQGKVAAAKEEAAKRGTTKFVSTNDVVTCSWGRMTRARLLEMAINFRGRIDGVGDRDAGNYEGCILFSSEDCDEPGLIRKALQRPDGHFKSTSGRKLPGFCELSKCRYRLITNWATFAKPLKLPGAENELHLPIFDLAGMVPTDMLFIFRPTADAIGVMAVTRRVDDATITGPDSFFGERILPEK